MLHNVSDIHKKGSLEKPCTSSNLQYMKNINEKQVDSLEHHFHMLSFRGTKSLSI